MSRQLIRNIMMIGMTLPASALSGQTSLESRLYDAFNRRQADLDLSTEIAKELYDEARALHNDSCASEALLLQGWNLQNQGAYEASNAAFTRLMSEAAGDYPDFRLATVYGRIGKNYSEMGDYPKAIRNLLMYDSLTQVAENAEGYAKEAYEAGMVEAKLLLGELYEYMIRPDEANRYYHEAYALAQEFGGRTQKMMTLHYLLDFNIVRQKHPEGYGQLLAEYLESMKTVKKDGAIDLGHAQLLFMGMPNAERVELLQRMRSDYEPLLGKYFATQNLVSSYLEAGQIEKALDVAETDYAFYRKSGNMPVLSSMHMTLSELYETSGRYKEASRHLKDYIHLHDSLSNIRIAKSVDSLNILYQTAQKEKQLHEQEMALIRERTRRRTLMFGLSGVLWFGTFLVLFFWNKNRLTKRIATQYAAIQRQQIQQLQQEKKLIAMSSMIEGQEVERKRIAQDLHDGLGGLLSTVKAQLEVIQHQVSKLESLDMYQKASSMIDNASNELRRITYNMMPSALTKLGLVAAVEDLADRLTQNHGLDVELQFLGVNGRLGETTEIMLYRIVQELCNNIVKHADADHVMIQMNYTPDELFLMIEDNGRGFDLQQLTHNKSVGLKSIESRARFLNGELDISSVPGKGTCITIQIPITRNGTMH